MLDQFRNDITNSQDDLVHEQHTRMSRKRLAYTLTGGAFALVLFLFLIGAFRQENEKPASSKSDFQVSPIAMTDLADRLEKLEIQVAKMEPAQNTPNSVAANVQQPSFSPQNPITDETLKQIITSQGFITEAEEQIPFGTEKPTPEFPSPEEVKPVPTPTPSPQGQIVKTYVVQKGDTLAKISQKFYGSTKYYKKIYSANRNSIANINQLKVGTKLRIPEKEEL